MSKSIFLNLFIGLVFLVGVFYFFSFTYNQFIEKDFLLKCESIDGKYDPRKGVFDDSELSAELILKIHSHCTKISNIKGSISLILTGILLFLFNKILFEKQHKKAHFGGSRL
jgi:hypothetical protein